MKTLLLLLFSGLVALPIAGQEPASSRVKPEGQAGSPEKPMRIRLGGGTAAAQLTNRVQPVYPPLGRQVRLSGTVRLHAIISTDGSVQQLEVVSGHPLLVQSALDAVRQWKYKPTLLNGKPVEVDTTIDVIYALADDSSRDSQASKIDPKLRDDIKRMLEVMHAVDRSTEVGRQMFDSMRPMLQSTLPNTPNRDKIIDTYENKLATIFQSEEYQEGAIAAYAKYFNDEDIQELTKFYQTPIGQKFNDNVAAFSGDMIRMGQALARQRIPGMLQELCKEYPELDGKIPDCRAADGDKKSQLMSPDSLGSRNAGD